MIKIRKKYIPLLFRCILKQKSNLMWILDSQDIIIIDEKLGNELRDLIGNEILECGIDEGRINEYGKELEALMDEIGEQFLC